MIGNNLTRVLILREAERRGWRIEYFHPNESVVRITADNGRSSIFNVSRPSETSANSVTISRNKALTLNFIESLGVKVPPFIRYDTLEAARAFLKEQGEIVVKPNNLERSVGVTMGIKDNGGLAEAVAEASKYSDKIIIQKQLTGDVFRILVIDGSFIAASKRLPAHVVGDGTHSVQELIEEKNKNPLRGNDELTHPLSKIRLDDVRTYLGESSLDFIPADAAFIKLGHSINPSSGGEAADVTDEIDESIKELSERIARELGLFTCGIDIITDSVDSPLDSGYLPIIEVNSYPGLKMHVFPTAGGHSRDVVGALLDAVFMN